MAAKIKIEKLEDLIKDSIGGDLVEQTVAPLLPPGSTFGSDVYKIDFKVRKDGKEEEYHAVGKCPPVNTTAQEFFNTQETFRSEIGWYTTVIPTVKQFHKDLGVEKEIDFFQPFYGARISLNPTSDVVDVDGILLTPNLTYLGYHIIDRHAGFDLPMTEKIINDLATYHALFLALKLQKPELFETKVKPYLSTLGDTTKLNDSRNKISFTIFDSIPEIASIMDRVKKSVNDGKPFVGRPLRDPWVTVIHMDVWLNNIMVIEGENPKIIFLDLSFPNLGSPAADLLFLLLTSVNFELIQEKLDYFIRFYYEKFMEKLEEVKIPTENYTSEGWLQEVDLEARIGEFAHCLGHIIGLLRDKPKDPSNKDSFDREKMKRDFAPNERQKEKYMWLATESAKRNWI